MKHDRLDAQRTSPILTQADPGPAGRGRRHCPLYGCKFLIFKALQPLHGGIRIDPGELPLGEISRGPLAGRDGRIEIAFAGQVRPELPVADGPQARQVRVQVAPLAGATRTSSRNPAAIISRKRRVDAPRKAPSRSTGSSAEGRERERAAARRASAGPTVRRPVSSTTSSARWMRWASAGWMRAAASGSRAASSACSAGQPTCARPRVDPRPDPGVRRGQRRDAPREGAEVEHRAADQQRHAAPRTDLGDQAQRVAPEPTSRVAVRRVADVDQVVRARPHGLPAEGLAVPMSMPR